MANVSELELELRRCRDQFKCTIKVARKHIHGGYKVTKGMKSIMYATNSLLIDLFDLVDPL